MNIICKKVLWLIIWMVFQNIYNDNVSYLFYFKFKLTTNINPDAVSYIFLFYLSRLLSVHYNVVL